MQTQNNTNKSNRLYSLLKKGYERFLKIRGQPREIALGLALGLFIAMTPTMGFQMALAVCLATFFKWNKISAAIGVWVTNPLTAPVIYPVCYYIGSRIYSVPKSQTVDPGRDIKLFYSLLIKAHSLLIKTPDLFIALTIGGVIVGLPLAIIGYYFAFTAIHRYQDEIKQSLAKRKQKKAIKAQIKRKRKKRANRRK